MLFACLPKSSKNGAQRNFKLNSPYTQTGSFFLHNSQIFLHNFCTFGDYSYTYEYFRRIRMNLAGLRNTIRKYWFLVGIVLLGVAAVTVWLTQSQTTTNPKFQTSTAALGSLTSSVGATGTVRAAQSATLVWNTSGRIENVYAALGARVNAGQPLADLAQDWLPQNLIIAQADLVTAIQSLDSLTQSNSVTASAMQKLSLANQNVKDAQDAYDSLTRKRVSDQLIQDTLDQITKAKKQLKQIEYIYNRFLGYKNMADGRSAKAQMTINITNLKQNITSLTAKYVWYTSTATPIEIEKSQAALNLAIAAQKDAEREMERVKNGASPDDLAAARARVAAAQATINLSKIITPFNGTITKVPAQPGDRVSPGQVAFRLDDLTKLMVDMQISEVDINNITINQPVAITFDAIPNKVYNGEVTKVNQAAKAGQGGVNFGVTVMITDADELVKPGMTASVMITVKQVGDALLAPNKAVRMLDGQRVVYILKNNLPLPVNIRVGAIADNYSQIVGGDLKPGDLIIENPPAATNNIPLDPIPTP
jgi:HlyD family secretion protein